MFRCRIYGRGLRHGRLGRGSGGRPGRRAPRAQLFQLAGSATASFLAALQKFDDFTPQRMLHCSIHVLKGLVFLFDVIFNGISIRWDGSFRLKTKSPRKGNC